MIRLTRWAGLVALLAAVPVVAEEKVELKVVNYDGLMKVVKDARGKVIVFDFWQDS